ncbi:MAG: PhoH family protein [Pseudomonadota bacterium]|jgi:phosphate starvation-inducible PhoH-like protein
MNLSKVSSSQIEIIEKNSDYLSFYIKNNFVLSKVIGEFDSNLKEIESLTGTKINLRGNLMIVRGNTDDRQSVVQILDNLIAKFLNTNNIEKEDIKTIFDVTKMNKLEVVKTNSIYGDHDAIRTSRKTVLPRSEKQKIYVEALKNNKIVMALGPAGTGKTFLAVAVAVTFLLEDKVKKIILSRPAVEAGENLGFLPGDMKDKIDPYLIPLYDSLYELLGYEKIQRKIEEGIIEIAPLAFMRGRTLKDSFVILDEAQNATFTQIKMFLTRLGNNSTMVINGDPSQVDLAKSKESGLYETTKILKDIKEIKTINFDHNDVMRHPLVSKIVKAYDDYKKEPNGKN